jgi:stress response protein SCP2
MLNLAKGQKIPLQNVLNTGQPFSVEIAVRGNDVYDCCCFALDQTGRCRDENFIYFNQLSGAGGVNLHSDSNSSVFNVSLSALSPDVRRLSFSISIDGAGTMGQVSSFTIEVKQGGAACLAMRLSGVDFHTEKAVIAAEVYEKNGWRFSAVAAGFNGGLADLLREYGMDVADDDAAPAPPKPAPPVQQPSVQRPPSAPPPVQQAAPPPKPAPPRPVEPRAPGSPQERYRLPNGETAYKYGGEEFIWSADDWV